MTTSSPWRKKQFCHPAISRPPIWQLAFWIFISLRDPWNGEPFRNTSMTLTLTLFSVLNYNCNPGEVKNIRGALLAVKASCDRLWLAHERRTSQRRRVPVMVGVVQFFQQIQKPHPPPIKTVHMAWKGGSYALYLGPYAILSVEMPGFYGAFMPYGPPLYGIFFCIFFQMWAVGVFRIGFILELLWKANLLYSIKVTLVTEIPDSALSPFRGWFCTIAPSWITRAFECFWKQLASKYLGFPIL